MPEPGTNVERMEPVCLTVTDIGTFDGPDLVVNGEERAEEFAAVVRFSKMEDCKAFACHLADESRWYRAADVDARLEAQAAVVEAAKEYLAARNNLDDDLLELHALNALQNRVAALARLEQKETHDG